jgi:hypothetical protein
MHLIGTRYLDLPACSIVPQPTRYRVDRNKLTVELVSCRRKFIGHKAAVYETNRRFLFALRCKLMTGLFRGLVFTLKKLHVLNYVSERFKILNSATEIFCLIAGLET